MSDVAQILRGAAGASSDAAPSEGSQFLSRKRGRDTGSAAPAVAVGKPKKKKMSRELKGLISGGAASIAEITPPIVSIRVTGLHKAA